MIYLATRGEYSDYRVCRAFTRREYSDYRVCHAFTRREDAEAYPLGDHVEELELRPGPVEVRYWYDLDWRADRPDSQEAPFAMGNPTVDSELRDFDGDERRAEHRWSAQWLNVQGWDRDHVMKVYSEQRAQYVATQEGVS